MKKAFIKVHNALVNKMSRPKSGKLKKKFHQSSFEISVPQDEHNRKTVVRFNSVQDVSKTKASTDSTNVLEELLQCGICYDRLLDPRMLSCQHTFCLICLKGYMKSVTERMMKKRQVPPSDKDIQRIMDKVPIPLSCPTCQKVMNIIGTLENLTDLPKNIHIDNLLKVMEPNETTAFNNSSFELSCIKCQTICQLPGKTCGHCVQVFCSVCWTEHLFTLKSNMSTLLEHLLASEAKLNKHMQDFHAQYDNISTEIEETTKKHILKIEEKRQKCLQKLNGIQDLEQQKIKELQRRIKKISTEIEALKFDQIASEDHKVNTFMNYHKATSKILENVSRCDNLPMFFDKNDFEINYANQIILDDNESVKSRNSTATTFNYYREQTFTTKLVWNKCPRPAGLGIPPWQQNHLYIATTTNKIVLIMDRSLTKITQKLSTPEMHCPQCIAFSQQRLEVYVTDKQKHCVHVFNHEGHYRRTLCNLGSEEGELRSPEGIAVTSNDNLVVCDTGNDRVVILNPENGNQIFSLASRAPFLAPTGVTVFNDKIIISDTGNHVIKVYSTSGKFLYEFGTVGSGKGQFRTAEVVVCDQMGIIFVGDSGNSRIQLFAPDGKFLRELSSHGKTSEKFLWISGLVVSSQFEIITSDFKQMCLQIFSSYDKM